jgi:hypothetical protein
MRRDLPRSFFFGVGLLTGAFEVNLASAQGNELSAPAGGRSSLMGNTGVALARDGSAPFLNPATIVRINDNSLAFSVNFYTFQATTLSGWHQPAPANVSQFGQVDLTGTSVSNSSFRILPSTLCLFFTVRGVTAQGSNDNGYHRGRQKLAICFGSSEFENVGLPALAFRGRTPLGLTGQAQSVTQSWNRFHAGPTYSISLGDNFAVGASLHGVYTTESFVIDSSSITAAEGGGSSASSLGAAGNAHGFDLQAILGAVYHAGNITLGASVTLPAVHERDLRKLLFELRDPRASGVEYGPRMRVLLVEELQSDRWRLDELDDASGAVPHHVSWKSRPESDEFGNGIVRCRFVRRRRHSPRSPAWLRLGPSHGRQSLRSAE